MLDASSLLLAAAFFDAQLTRWVVWVGLVVLTVALLLLVRTRWGQSQPLGKCVVLSLVAHLLLAIYTTTVRIVSSSVGSPDGAGIQVALIDSSALPGQEDETGTQPWETTDEVSPAVPPAENPVELPPLPVVEPTPTEPTPPVPAPMPAAPSPVPAAEVPPPSPEHDADPLSTKLSPVPPEPVEDPKVTPADDVPPPEQPPVPDPAYSPGPPKTDVPPPTALEPPAASSAVEADENLPLVSIPPATANAGGGGKALAGPSAGAAKTKGVPDVFSWRMGNHTQVAKGLGATQESEAHVLAALKWLASNQSANGRWQSRQLGGGGLAGDSQNRDGSAGAHADSGITGLALLAFLAAGHTHLQGPYRPTVRHGLEFLLSVQAADGNLGNSNNVYEKMYCHAMATCALSEAYAMTGDDRLQNAVRRAVAFTVRMQELRSGGWRYRPGDTGDTSQLGWQLMALKSAELAGVSIPPSTRDGVQKFLKSVAAGRDGGLARYRPYTNQAPSRSMTAEALVCRQFLEIPNSPGALDEASSYLMQELPGTGQPNLYYWYYATIALCQAQGEPWRRWNEALQKQLLPSQRTDGDLAGSWDPDPVWGGCGGRAYSTALSALCLEVYYRFLPLFVDAAARERRVK